MARSGNRTVFDCSTFKMGFRPLAFLPLTGDSDGRLDIVAVRLGTFSQI
jgi:hypothetical protein